MKWHKNCILACVLLMQGQFFCAQTPYTWQDFVEDMADDQYAEEENWSQQMEELAQLAANPMDINTATREQLQQLPFLNDEQIEEIHTYIFLHGGMRSLGELMAISSIDLRTRRFLSLFVNADVWPYDRKDTLSLKSMLKHSRHELSTRVDIPFYYRLGYSYPPDKGGYKGSTLYHNLRYRLTSTKHLEAGLSAEKDQGEPFRGNKGWDHYGGYLSLHDIGILRTLSLGDFRVGFGEGLVVNSGFSTGKSGMIQPTQGVRAKRGMDEYNYFRGLATTLGGKHFNGSVWLSYRRLDATLRDDGTVSTLLTNGLHRTNSELDRKHNLKSMMAGGNLTWKKHGFHAGLTGYYQRFHRDFSPGEQVYRHYYPSGRDFGVIGANYGYSHVWFKVSGETAYSTEKGGWATLHRASWKISDKYMLTASHRFYSYKYYSFYASALSENSRVQNESGGMLRLDATPRGRLNVVAYIDFFYNPWPRYSMTHSSQGQELMAQAEYQIKRNNTIGVRYQLKRKEESDQMRLHNRLRLQYTRMQGKWWRLQSTLLMHSVDAGGVGWALSQRVRFKKEDGGLSALLTYFNSPNYATRLFQYEPLLTNMFRFPMYYGKGFRLATSAHYTFWKQRLTAEVLYSITRYTDRESQGSGMQLIDSPWKQDLSLQLRFRI